VHAAEEIVRDERLEPLVESARGLPQRLPEEHRQGLRVRHPQHGLAAPRRRHRRLEWRAARLHDGGAHDVPGILIGQPRTSLGRERRVEQVAFVQADDERSGGRADAGVSERSGAAAGRFDHARRRPRSERRRRRPDSRVRIAGVHHENLDGRMRLPRRALDRPAQVDEHDVDQVQEQVGEVKAEGLETPERPVEGVRHVHDGPEEAVDEDEAPVGEIDQRRVGQHRHAIVVHERIREGVEMGEGAQSGGTQSRRRAVRPWGQH